MFGLWFGSKGPEHRSRSSFLVRLIMTWCGLLGGLYDRSQGGYLWSYCGHWNHQWVEAWPVCAALPWRSRIMTLMKEVRAPDLKDTIYSLSGMYLELIVPIEEFIGPVQGGPSSPSFPMPWPCTCVGKSSKNEPLWPQASTGQCLNSM